MPTKSLSVFYNENLKQGDNLRKGLFGYHQQLYQDPETVAALLSAKHIGDMSSENPHARNLWFRCLAKQLCKFLKIDRPRRHSTGASLHA